jgi:hypothetical protein
MLTSLVLGRRASAVAPARDDFKSAVARRASLGTWHAIEVALLHDVVDFGGLRARSLMTPRVDVVFLDLRQPVAVWIATLAKRPFGVYPGCDGKPDRLLGVVYARTSSRSLKPSRARCCAPLAPPALDAERPVVRMQEGARLAILLDEHAAWPASWPRRPPRAVGEIEGLRTRPSPCCACGRDMLLVRATAPCASCASRAASSARAPRGHGCGAVACSAASRVAATPLPPACARAGRRARPSRGAVGAQPRTILK